MYSIVIRKKIYHLFYNGVDTGMRTSSHYEMNERLRKGICNPDKIQVTIDNNANVIKLVG